MSDHDKQEGPAYDRFADKAKEFFAKSSEQSLSSLEKAIESAKEHLIKAGELSQQQAEHFKVFLRRDLEQAAKNVHHWGEVTSEQVKENLNCPITKIYHLAALAAERSVGKVGGHKHLFFTGWAGYC